MKVVVPVGGKWVIVGTCLDILPRLKAGDHITAHRAEPGGVVRVLRWRCGLLPSKTGPAEVVVMLDHDAPHPSDLPGWEPGVG